MKPNIAEIRKRVTKIQEGTWIPQEDCSHCKGDGNIRDPDGEKSACFCLISEDRYFNGEAADIIEDLCDEVERQAEEIGNARSLRDFAVKKANELSKLLDNANNAIEPLNAELDFERAENERLRKALAQAEADLMKFIPNRPGRH